jgi:hypothetical protein
MLLTENTEVKAHGSRPMVQGPWFKAHGSKQRAVDFPLELNTRRPPKDRRGALPEVPASFLRL